MSSKDFGSHSSKDRSPPDKTRVRTPPPRTSPEDTTQPLLHTEIKPLQSKRHPSSYATRKRILWLCALAVLLAFASIAQWWLSPSQDPAATIPAETVVPDHPETTAPTPMADEPAVPSAVQPQPPSFQLQPSTAPMPTARPSPYQQRLQALRTQPPVNLSEAERERQLNRLYQSFNEALAADRLSLPDSTSASEYLLQLTLLGGNTPRILQARSQLVQAYLQRAREARTQGRWEDAEADLQLAVEIRLSDYSRLSVE